MPPLLSFQAEPLSIRRVLILKSIRLHAEMIRRIVYETWPEADILIVGTVTEAVRLLSSAPVDFLITGLGMRDGDACGLVRDCAVEPRRAGRIVVVTGRDTAWVRQLLQLLPIDSAFDALNDSPSGLSDVLRRTAEGERCFSPEFLAFPCAGRVRSTGKLGDLTATELLVFSLIGYSWDHQKIAESLDLSFATIAAVSRSLHRRLGVRHDRELTSRAAELGLVCAEFGQRHLIGFDAILDRYEAVRRKERSRPLRVAALRGRDRLRGPVGFPKSGTEG